MRVDVTIATYDEAMEFANGLGAYLKKHISTVVGASVSVDQNDSLQLILRWTNNERTIVTIRNNSFSDGYSLYYTVTPVLREYIVTYGNWFMISRHANELLSGQS